jgi:hypothetical protein
VGQFDQTARQLSKLSGSAFFGWGLACSGAAPRLTFTIWDDARRLVSPGEPDRTNDLVAQLHDEDRPNRPVWLVAEIEAAPERGILYRVGHYQFLLGKEVNPDCDANGPLVGALLVNLTGEQKVRRLDWMWLGSDHGTLLAPFIVDVASQDAEATLGKIEAGSVGLPILPYVVLMKGGCEPGVIQRWPRVAERDPDVERRVKYRDAALVFAELTRGQVDWLRALEGWMERESEYIKRWRDEGVDLGTLKRSRDYLLKRVRRLADPVPEAIRLAIEGTNDLQTLDRWFDAALDCTTIADFRKAMNLAP